MNLSQAVSNYLSTQFGRLNEIYKWNFKLDGFPDASYVQVGNSGYERSRHLRNHIFNVIKSIPANSHDYQVWYVRNWGGIKSNKLETLRCYTDAGDCKLLALQAKGVATWSKMLSLRNPNLYAIYDARVAVSLNSIQKKYNVDNPVLFPQLSSRNTTFVMPTQDAIKKSNFFPSVDKMNFYKNYLDLLHQSVANQKGYDIQDAEMVLFAAAEELSSVWSPSS